MIPIIYAIILPEPSRKDPDTDADADANAVVE